MKKGVLWIIGLVSSSLPSAAQTTFLSASGTQWEVHSFRDQMGESRPYYLTGSGPGLVVILQGSGCVPAFAAMGGRSNVATSLQDSFAEKLPSGTRLMVVERPGLRQNDSVGAKPGQSEGCSLAFRKRYSLDDWGNVIQRAIAHATRSGTVALVGISEGTKTATWQTQHGFLGPILSIGGAGCDGDVVGMIAQSISRSRHSQPGTSLKETLRTIEQIKADPLSITKFAWGHTYLRWSSFGDQCSGPGLTRYSGLIHIAYGSADEGADVVSIERLARARTAESLPTRIERIERADHGLFRGEKSHAPDVFTRFLNASHLAKH